MRAATNSVAATERSLGALTAWHAGQLRAKVKCSDRDGAATYRERYAGGRWQLMLARCPSQACTDVRPEGYDRLCSPSERSALATPTRTEAYDARAADALHTTGRRQMIAACRLYTG
jgi:hypothetical protein